MIETLGEARTALFDKTGTLTVGTPDLRQIVTGGEVSDGELRLAASVDRMSAHVLGEALVRAAAEAELPLSMPSEVREDPGQGIEGTVDGRRVAVGSRAFLRSAGCPPAEVAAARLTTGHGSGRACALVGVDGRLAGVIVMADELRPDADRIIDDLRREGVRHVAMVSGDRRSVAERVGRELGIDRSTPSSHPRTSSRWSAGYAPTASVSSETR